MRFLSDALTAQVEKVANLTAKFEAVNYSLFMKRRHSKSRVTRFGKRRRKLCLSGR